MSVASILTLLGGLAVLTAGAEALVRGASRLAARYGISPLVIGLTVVAYGTSTPELVVSIYASWRGNPDIAVANVVGSNIFNVLFILGLCALLRPLVVTSQLLRRDVPLLIGVSVLLVLFAWNGQLGAVEGVILLAGVVAYTVFSIRQSRRESRAVQEEFAEAYGTRTPPALLPQVALVLAGLVLLVVGARWFVGAAIDLARSWGVSETIIGLTIVAAGTSLPEVATSVVATLRGQRDIAIGNVVGSNIYNILAILGVSTLVSGTGLRVSTGIVDFDLPVMVAVAAACLPLFFTGRLLARWEGALFLGYYAAYTAYLVLAAQQHDLLPLFSRTMLTFVLPLTGLTFLVVVTRSLRRPAAPGRTRPS